MKTTEQRKVEVYESDGCFFSDSIKKDFGENKMVFFNNGDEERMVCVSPLQCDPKGLTLIGYLFCGE